jgi:hypothetical protein
LETSLYQKPLLLAAFGLAILLTLVVLWARRDRVWKGLLWLAVAESVVTAFAYYVVTFRGSEPGVWARLQSSAFIATGNWEAAVRVLCAWLLVTAIALFVRGRMRSQRESGHSSDDLRA